MNHLIHLSIYDLRTSFRDGLMKGLLFVPFLNLVAIRWGWPLVVSRFPDLGNYDEVVLMWAMVQSAMMFGFIYGFLFLEEKEEGILDVVRILPISGLQLIVSRLLIGLVVSALVNMMLVVWGGLVDLPWWQSILLAMQYGLIAPFIALLLGIFSANRIEGMAQTKIYNLLTYVPGLIYFLPWEALHLLAIVPTYWSFRSLELAVEGSPHFYWVFLLGTLFYLSVIYYLSKRMEASGK